MIIVIKIVNIINKIIKLCRIYHNLIILYKWWIKKYNKVKVEQKYHQVDRLHRRIWIKNIIL